MPVVTHQSVELYRLTESPLNKSDLGFTISRNSTPSLSSESLSSFGDDTSDSCCSEETDCALPLNTLAELNQLVDASEEDPAQRRLNPLARPFIPNNPLTTRVTQRRPMPPWSQMFQAAAQTCRENNDERIRIARSVVALFQETSIVIDLVMLLARTALERTPHDGLALFALQIHRQLAQQCSVHVAEDFLHHLNQCLFHNFRSCWDTAISERAISCQYGPTVNYVHSAQHLCSFIGELCTLEIVRQKIVLECIKILLDELATHEHIQALFNLISSAQPTVWVNAEKELDWSLANQFLTAFLHRARILRDGHSVLGQSLRNGGCKKRIQAMEDLVRSCFATVIDTAAM